MKTTVAFFCAFLICGSTFANDLKWTCQSSDRSLVVTQDQGFLLSKNADTQSIEVTALKNNQPLKALKAGDTIIFTSPQNPQRILLNLKVVKIFARQTLAEDYGRACEPHQGPAFHTESFRMKTTALELECVETTYWSGACFQLGN